MDIEKCYTTCALQNPRTPDKNRLQFKYHQVSLTQFSSIYSQCESKKIIQRKLLALPMALVAVIKTIVRVAKLLIINLPLLCCGKKAQFKATWFSVVRDFQEVFGRIMSLFCDRFGLFHIQESAFHKQKYRESLKPLTVEETSGENAVESTQLEEDSEWLIKDFGICIYYKKPKEAKQELAKMKKPVNRYKGYIDIAGLYAEKKEMDNALKNLELALKLKIPEEIRHIESALLEYMTSIVINEGEKYETLFLDKIKNMACQDKFFRAFVHVYMKKFSEGKEEIYFEKALQFVDRKKEDQEYLNYFIRLLIQEGFLDQVYKVLQLYSEKLNPGEFRLYVGELALNNLFMGAFEYVGDKTVAVNANSAVDAAKLLNLKKDYKGMEKLYDLIKGLQLASAHKADLRKLYKQIYPEPKPAVESSPNN